MQGMRSLLVARVVPPGYEFLHNYKAFALYDYVRAVTSPLLFERVAKAAADLGMAGAAGEPADGRAGEDAAAHRQGPQRARRRGLLPDAGLEHARIGPATARPAAAWELMRVVGVLPGRADPADGDPQGSAPRPRR